MTSVSCSIFLFLFSVPRLSNQVSNAPIIVYCLGEDFSLTAGVFIWYRRRYLKLENGPKLIIYHKWPIYNSMFWPFWNFSVNIPLLLVYQEEGLIGGFIWLYSNGLISQKINLLSYYFYIFGPKYIIFYNTGFCKGNAVFGRSFAISFSSITQYV